MTARGEPGPLVGSRGQHDRFVDDDGRFGSLVDLVDDAMHEEVVRRRGLRRGLGTRATESATWVGTLRDLAERRIEVAIQLAGGRGHRGRLSAVATDHLVLTGDGTATVVIALSAVRTLRQQADLPAAAVQGDRGAADARTLPETLDELLAQGTEVVVGLDGIPDPLRGRAGALGDDVLTVATLAGGAVLVPLHALADVAWGMR